MFTFNALQQVAYPKQEQEEEDEEGEFSSVVSDMNCLETVKSLRVVQKQPEDRVKLLETWVSKMVAYF